MHTLRGAYSYRLSMVDVQQACFQQDNQRVLVIFVIFQAQHFTFPVASGAFLNHQARWVWVTLPKKRMISRLKCAQQTIHILTLDTWVPMKLEFQAMFWLWFEVITTIQLPCWDLGVTSGQMWSQPGTAQLKGIV